jgi:hypothetical protein
MFRTLSFVAKAIIKKEGVYTIMAWTRTVTSVGEALIASAFGATLNYTTVKAGSGSVPVEELVDQTDVTDFIKNFAITAVSSSGSQSVLNARLDNSGILTETPLTQIGVFANINDEPEVLMIILQTDTPSTIPTQEAQPGYGFEPQFNLAISGIANFTANIDWNAFAKLSDIQNMTANFVVKVPGMGLSTNDYTTADKNKLAGIEEGATSTVVVQSVGSSQTAVMSQKAVTDRLLSSSVGFLVPKNFTINGTDVEIIDYDPSEWNPNFVVPFGETIPTPTDMSSSALAIQEATDPITNATDAINAFVWDTSGQEWIAATSNSISVETGYLFFLYPPGAAAEDWYWNASSFSQIELGSIDPSQFAPASHVADQLQSETGVHGIRYWQGKLQYDNGQGQGWATVQTGVGIGIGSVEELSIDGADSALIISWADPDDLTLQGVTVSKWLSTTLVRKDSGYPDDIDDGTLVVTNTVRNQYAEGYTDSGLVNGETYYYRLFPVSESGVLNTDIANQANGEAGYNPFRVPAEEWTYDDGSGNLSVFVKLPRFRISDVIPGSTNTNWHPAFIVNGNVVPHIWIGKYPANVVNNKAYSKIGVTPTVSITFDNAKAACEANGTGHHLITNAEWSAIALWCKANGFMPDGNNNSSAAVASGSANPAWYHNNDLSGIEGLNGNVWEWCGGLRLNAGEINIIANNDAAVTGADQSAASALWKAIMPDGTLVAPGTSGTVKYTTEYNNTAFATVVTVPAAAGAGAELLQCLGLIPSPGSVSADYGDDALWVSLLDERLPDRGGNWTNGASAGVFALNINDVRSNHSTYRGFRGAFVNL